MEGVPTKILGRATLIDHKKHSRPIGPREKEDFFLTKRNDAIQRLWYWWEWKRKLRWFTKWPEKLRFYSPRGIHYENVKKIKRSWGEKRVLYWRGRSAYLKLPNQQGVYCWWFRVSVWKWIRHPFWLILIHDHSMYPLWPAETNASRTAEWVDIVRVFYDRRSGKFKCTSALNKLRIREESASFEPPALINLIRATSLAPNWQIHRWNVENEWFMYDLSTKDLHFT